MSDLPAKGDKFLILEGIRGTAAIFVAIRHTYIWWNPIYYGESYLAVDLFFLLSGVVLAYSYEARIASGRIGAGPFMALRLLRIYPLYLLGSSIGLVAVAIWGDPQLGGVLLYFILALGFVPNYFLPNPDLYPLNHPAWSLLLEFIANFAYVLSVPAVPSRRLLLAAALALAFFAVGVAGHQSADVGYRHGELAYGICRALFSFLIGVLVCRNLQRIVTWTGALPPLGTSLIIVVGILFIPTIPLGAARIGYDLAMIAVVFPLIVALALRMPVKAWEAKVMGFLGVVSYPVYVLHVPVSTALLHLCKRLGLDVTAYAPWSGLTLMAGLLGLSYALAQFVDLPLRNAIKGRLAAPPPLPTRPAG